MRCIHIYRGAPQLGGIKLHKHFSWFHTAKWGVHRIAPRTVLHVIRIVLTMELQPLKTVELHGWVCLPDSLVRNGSTSPIHTDYKRTHTHTHTHTCHTHTHTHKYTHTHTHTHTHRSLSPISIQIIDKWPFYIDHGENQTCGIEATLLMQKSNNPLFYESY